MFELRDIDTALKTTIDSLARTCARNFSIVRRTHLEAFTGSFVSQDGRTVNVENGIIISVTDP